MDGKKLELWDLIMQLNKRAGKAGCGFHQIVEDRIVGLKVRGVYENPAASVLIAAHKKLEYLVSTREENEFKNNIDNKWAYLCYGAKYFEPTMKHIRAYLASSNERVSGTAKVTLYKGQIFVASTTSPYSLFNSSMATFDADLGAFNQNASPGFIELYNLAQKTSHAVGEQAKRKLAPAGAPKKKAKK
jgi:argininosuccinate synthase